MANCNGSSPAYFHQSSSLFAAVKSARSFLFVLFLLAGILAARWLALAIESTTAKCIAQEEIRLHIDWLNPALAKGSPDGEKNKSPR
jgi:hypothetical protein